VNRVLLQAMGTGWIRMVERLHGSHVEFYIVITFAKFDSSDPWRIFPIYSFVDLNTKMERLSMSYRVLEYNSINHFVYRI
jgi:hypothetical protein